MHPTLGGGAGSCALPNMAAYFIGFTVPCLSFFFKQHILKMALLLVYREIPYLLSICIYLPYSVDVWIP